MVMSTRPSAPRARSASIGCSARDLILALVVSRILDPGSKLAAARALSPDTATSSLGEQLGLGLLPEEELQAALGRLVASELVFRRGTPPDAVYAFKHALVQDAAHGSLLRSARQQLHAQIAEALETHSPELMDSQPELFAQHYAEAGLGEKSVACWPIEPADCRPA
jgi:hypothetical protein